MRQDRRPKRERSIQIGGQEELQMIWTDFSSMSKVSENK